jgi:S-adenosylmethionine synthetase
LKEIVLQLISTAFGHFKFTIEVNTRDDGGKSDYYLTLTGSALESGDEGVVGRGNRHNGVISFTRHMSLEAACGKNPVYHVGKVYTALGSIIAKEIYKMTGRENCVYLTSQIGRSIQDPWSIAVEVSGVKLNQRYKKMIQEIVEAALANVRLVTNKIIKGEVILY